MSRGERLENGLSGYDSRAYQIDEVKSNLQNLKSGNSIEIRQYGHKSGVVEGDPIKIDPSKVVIVEGLHAMHSELMDQIDISIFIFTGDEQLVNIRKDADLIKRNHSREFSNEISESELLSYKENVEPYKNIADVMIFLESKWEYKLIRKKK